MQRPRAPSRYLPEIQDAQSEDVRLTRAAAWDAYYRLRLVAPSPGVEEQAREVINAIKGLRASDSLEALDDAGESVRHRIDALIDDARTPLIISGPLDDRSDFYATIDRFIPLLAKEDYEVDEKQRTTALTESGNEKMEKALGEAGYLKGDLYDVENVSTVHHVNQALKAIVMFKLDIDYIVKDGKVASLNIEAPGKFEVSDAATLLAQAKA